jgi:LPXTG-motif cell wall-anchored protein
MGWVSRVTGVAGTAVVLGLATVAPAWADSTISINPGNVPTKAADYGQGCDFGGGRHPDKDIWVFVLPKNGQDSGVFVAVTATFDTGSGTKTLTIPDDGGAIVNKGNATSKAWIATPAGWELTGATAKITGTADKFNLTHTCAANGGGHSPSPSPSPSVGASTAPAGGGSVGSGAGSAGASGGGLPVTGTAVTTIALTGGLLVGGGAALLLFRRRLQGTR